MFESERKNGYMNAQEIIDLFSKSRSSKDKEMISSFLSKMIGQDLPKGHFLHIPEKICNKMYFVERGIVRTYYNHDGKDVTVYFTVEGEMVTAIDSFIQRKPSKYYIELLEDTTLYSFSYHDLESHYKEFPGFERFGRLLMERAYMDLVDRAESIQLLSATDRYKKLIEAHPTLPHRVNLGHIASYLGISQETLSRVRSQFH